MIPPLVALDVGSTKVACAVGSPHENGDGFELLGTGFAAYPSLSETGPSDPLLISQTIERAIEATAVRADFQRALVAFSHPSLRSERVQTAVNLSDEAIVVRSHHLERLQMNALSQTLGVDREALLVERIACSGNGFGGLRDPLGLSATRLLGDFHIVTMPMAIRQVLVQAVEAVGLEVTRLCYSLSAVLASVVDEEMLRKRVVLFDAGGSTTDIGLFLGGVLDRLAVVPSGGLTLASKIAKDMHVTMDQALTWSLEGTACRKPGVKDLVLAQWDTLKHSIEDFLQGQPQPDGVILTGRGSMIDGFAEWVEQATGVSTALGRSARMNRTGDLSRQFGLSHAIGLLETFCRATGSKPASDSPHFINHLISRTRTLLTEYF